MNVLHPLFVHLHIAFLLMAFLAMGYWLIKGLGSSVFEDKVYQFARVCTKLGVVFIVLSMAAGVRDGLHGTIAHFSGMHGGWLLVKALLAMAMLGYHRQICALDSPLTRDDRRYIVRTARGVAPFSSPPPRVAARRLCGRSYA